MKRILILAMMTALACTAAASRQIAPENPNVVIIHVDDMGWRDAGYMGSPVYETPNIDRLAKSGTLFTSAYAAANICTPSRACMLTGSQPSRHGVYTVVKNRGKKQHWVVTPKKNNQFLPKEYPTIATELSKAGIANGSVGKWHVSAKVPAHGFTEGKWGGYLGLPINYFAPFKLGFLPKDVPDGAYLPTYIRAAGVQFVEKHRKDPFFLYFCTYLPHDEIKNEGEESQFPGIFRLDAPENVVNKYKEKIKTLTDAGKDLQGHTNAVYAAMIEETDRSVGAIVDKLDELKLRENTLILFISDNGGLSKYTSQRPLRGQKCTLYEGGIRVPMIASMPGQIAEGKVSDEPVSGMDFYPTICRLMDVRPTDPKLVDGEDLTDLLFKGKSLGERNLFWNFPVYNRPQDSDRSPRSVMRRGDWKIHHRYEDGTYELYNLKEDIGESKDLAKSNPKDLKRMRGELESCYDRFGAAKSLPANPEYDKAEAEAEKVTAEVQPQAISTEKAYRKMGLAAKEADTKVGRPNIVWIFSDDHATQAIGAYGGRLQKEKLTPNIDSLARDGIIFDRCYVGNSICAPSRATLLTGKHSHMHGKRDNVGGFNHDQPQFQKILQKSGYQTAMIGKIHLKGAMQGFDYWEVLPGQGAYVNPTFITEEGQTRYQGHCTDIVTDRALNWMETGRDKEQPFMVMIHYKAPHRNWTAAKRFQEAFRDRTFPEPESLFDDYKGRGTAAHEQDMSIEKSMRMGSDVKSHRPERKAYLEKHKPEGDDLVRWKYHAYMQDYLACIAGVDENIGRVLAYLRDNGLDKNTVVMYSSDQGFYLGEHGWFDKRFMYEESFRTPLLARWPGVIKPGLRNGDLVQNIDFAETFLEIAGASIPDDMQGRSLLPLLKGETPADWRTSLYYHYYEYPGCHSVRRHEGVANKRYKLMRFYGKDVPGGEEWEFYDLQKDPNEMKSAYNTPEYQKNITELKGELLRLRDHYQVPSEGKVTRL